MWEHDGRTERIRVPDEGLTIGRKPSTYGASYCTTNGSISRQHCRLARLGDGWYIEDLGSANGTSVNGELAEAPTPLRYGDVIVLGGSDGLRAQLVMPMVGDPIGGTMDEEQTQFAQREPLERIRTSYDIVAQRYANELADDMIARPIERGLMLGFAELVRPLGAGVIGDVGCGPGHVAKHLAALGIQTIGFDISPAMVEQAKRKHPDGDFRVGSMFDMPIPTGEWNGAVALWSTLHFNAEERARALREMCRVTRPGGFVLHGFYVSAPDQPPGSMYHLQKWFGYQVDLDTYFVAIDDANDEMERAGFDVVAALVREPMSPNELPTRRCYMIGCRNAR